MQKSGFQIPAVFFTGQADYSLNVRSDYKLKNELVHLRPVCNPYRFNYYRVELNILSKLL